MDEKAIVEISSPPTPEEEEQEFKIETGKIETGKVEPGKIETGKIEPGKIGTATVICVVLTIVMFVVALILFKNVIFNGAKAVADGYNAAVASEKEATYQAFYQKYYDKAEAEHHVANRSSIYIGNIRETGWKCSKSATWNSSLRTAEIIRATSHPGLKFLGKEHM